MCGLGWMWNLDPGVTHLSVQTLLLRLQLTEGALELFQLTLKTRNFPLSQEFLLLLHTLNITLKIKRQQASNEGQPTLADHFKRMFLVFVDCGRKQNSKVTTVALQHGQ